MPEPHTLHPIEARELHAAVLRIVMRLLDCPVCLMEHATGLGRLQDLDAYLEDCIAALTRIRTKLKEKL